MGPRTTTADVWPTSAPTRLSGDAGEEALQIGVGGNPSPADGVYEKRRPKKGSGCMLAKRAACGARKEENPAGLLVRLDYLVRH